MGTGQNRKTRRVRQNWDWNKNIVGEYSKSEVNQLRQTSVIPIYSHWKKKCFWRLMRGTFLKRHDSCMKKFFFHENTSLGLRTSGCWLLCYPPNHILFRSRFSLSPLGNREAKSETTSYCVGFPILSQPWRLCQSVGYIDQRAFWFLGVENIFSYFFRETRLRNTSGTSHLSTHRSNIPFCVLHTLYF